MVAAPTKKMPREEVPAGKHLCEYCTAKCCKYFALPIETPTEPKDFDFIRWYLLHDRASVFIEEEDWYILVHTTCKHLLPDNRCGIYETRPQICRDYKTDGCEYEDDWTYDHYFETPEQVQEYADAVFANPGADNFRSPQAGPVAGDVANLAYVAGVEPSETSAAQGCRGSFRRLSFALNSCPTNSFNLAPSKAFAISFRKG